jgi:hypothetical protein
MQMPEQPDRTMTVSEQADVIAALSKALQEKYVFPDVATKMADRLRERLNGHAYDTVTSAKKFSALLTADLAAIAHDKHLRVNYFAQPLPAPGTPPPAGRDQFMTGINYGFDKVERLAGNVGYLKFDAFADPNGPAGEIAAAAMNFLAGTDALIIDLRENHGGSPAMVAFICSYFFDGRPVHLNDLYWRPSNTTQQWWTLAYVPGKRYLDKEIYLLTSSGTFSAGEEFTNDLKTQKRAIVVGETTGGGANPGGMERLGEHFGAFVPSGRAINPITNSNWEGTGVSPDLPVPAAQAFNTAYREALKKLTEKKRNPMLDREAETALAKLASSTP